MKIEYDAHNYIEMILQGNKVVISICAKDGKNPLNTIINSCDITLNELSKLLNSLNVEIPNLNKQ